MDIIAKIRTMFDASPRSVGTVSKRTLSHSLCDRFKASADGFLSNNIMKRWIAIATIMAVLFVATVGTTAAADLKVTSTNLNTLNSFTNSGAWYNVGPNNYLLKWYGGAENFEPGFKAPALAPPAYRSIITATTMADYKGSLWGECVSMVKNLAHSTITATNGGWSRGQSVMSGGVSPGTVIARFSPTSTPGKFVYKNGNHAAVFREYTRDSSGKINGMIVWDQNWGYDGLVRMHKISKTNSGSVSDANSYYVVQV